MAGTAAIEIALDVFVGQRDQRRAAIDHAADRDPVAFAEGRDPEQMAEGVVGHLRCWLAKSKSILTCGNARRSNRQPSFRGDAKHRTRNLEIPGLVLRTIPE
jgi:hypothetical protein